MKVKFIGYGILMDDKGGQYICDADGYGSVLSCDTGELYKISARDESANPIEIKPL